MLGWKEELPVNVRRSQSIEVRAFTFSVWKSLSPSLASFSQSPEMTADQLGDGVDDTSRLFRNRSTIRPTRNATRTTVSAKGRRSRRLVAKLTAAPEIKPMQEPTIRVFDARGYFAPGEACWW